MPVSRATLLLIVLHLESIWGVSWSSEIVYEWTALEFDWPTAEDRQKSIQNGSFIPKNNAPTGIKVFKDQVFITVPRWKPGVPSSLNKIIEKNDKSLLQPFPDWKMNRIGYCIGFQYVQSMEILPATEEMWIIDVGRINILVPGKIQNLCPAKLAILNLNSLKITYAHNFTNDVVSATKNFLNDLVLDPIRRIAFITNPGETTIVVLNTKTDTAHKVHHSSMRATLSSIVVHDRVINNTTPIDGIAMSPDFSTIFYCALAATDLYSVPVEALLAPSTPGDKFRRVGDKQSSADGLAATNQSLYFGALAHDSVMRWKVYKDVAQQGSTWGNVSMKTKSLLRRDERTLQWADTFAVDEGASLWWVSNRLQDFFAGKLNFSGEPGHNFRVWKVYIGESSYLASYTGNSANGNQDSKLFVLVFAFLFAVGIKF